MARGRNEEAGAAVGRALAQASFGAFLRREGKLSAAVEQLEAAREGFVRLGAHPSLESCDRELAWCGPLPRGRHTVDPRGLTLKEVGRHSRHPGETNREWAASWPSA